MSWLSGFLKKLEPAVQQAAEETLKQEIGDVVTKTIAKLVSGANYEAMIRRVLLDIECTQQLPYQQAMAKLNRLAESLKDALVVLDRQENVHG